jgi:hypothetical protein
LVYFSIMQDADKEKPIPPMTAIDPWGGTRVRRGKPITEWGRTGEEIEDDFKEETGQSLDSPAYLRRRRREQTEDDSSVD